MWPDCPPCLLPEVEVLLIVIVHCFSGQALTTRELSFLYCQLDSVEGTLLLSTFKKWKHEILSKLGPQLVANLSKHPLYRFHADEEPLYPATSSETLAAIDMANVDAATVAKRCRLVCPAYTPVTGVEIAARPFEEIIRAASVGALVIEVDQPESFF